MHTGNSDLAQQGVAYHRLLIPLLALGSLTLALESCHQCPCIAGGLMIVWKVEEIIADFVFIVIVF